MPHYDVKLMVTFRGEIHANSREEAEQYAQDKWGEHAGAEMEYDGVYSCDADELDKAESEVESCPAGSDCLEEDDEEEED